MKKLVLAIALVATSFGMINASNNVNVNMVSSVDNSSSVYATKEYKGTATVEKMAGNPSSGSYEASFNIDPNTKEINGTLKIVKGGVVIHNLHIEGYLDDGATGYLTVPGGSSFDFNATFSDVNVTEYSVTFKCTGVIPALGNAESIFTFVGTSL